MIFCNFQLFQHQLTGQPQLFCNSLLIIRNGLMIYLLASYITNLAIGVYKMMCMFVTIQSSDECLSLPEVLLVRADDCRTLAGVQLDGQPTCAFVVSRNDYQKIEQLLKDKSIRNIRYCIGFCGENMVFLIYVYLY